MKICLLIIAPAIKKYNKNSVKKLINLQDYKGKIAKCIFIHIT